MDNTAVSVLLGVLSSLVAALIFVVKWLVKRSDEQRVAAEKHIGALITATQAAVASLERAVVTFQSFEEEETTTHAAMKESDARMVETQKVLLETQATLMENQRRILVILERIENKLSDY